VFAESRDAVRAIVDPADLRQDWVGICRSEIISLLALTSSRREVARLRQCVPWSKT
jgi:hypothetical protein